jgi:hypothetical protein
MPPTSGIFQEIEPPSKKSSPSPQGDQVRGEFSPQKAQKAQKGGFFGSVIQKQDIRKE